MDTVSQTPPNLFYYIYLKSHHDTYIGREWRQPNNFFVFIMDVIGVISLSLVQVQT